MDKETETLVKIILLLETLSSEAKDRIITYLDMRYLSIPECDLKNNYIDDDGWEDDWDN